MHLAPRGARQCGACVRRSGGHHGGLASRGAAEDQSGRRQISGYAEGPTAVRWLHQLPAAECVQIRRRRGQSERLVPALLPEDLGVGLKMQLMLRQNRLFSINRTDRSGY
jgi:hypothetical protein